MNKHMSNPAGQRTPLYLPTETEIREQCDAILAGDTRRGLLRRRGWLKEDEESGAAFFTVPVCRSHAPA